MRQPDDMHDCPIPLDIQLRDAIDFWSKADETVVTDTEISSDVLGLLIELRDTDAHKNKRLAELEAELKTHKDKLVHVGYTNPHQVKYAKDESGLFYPDTENECYIPLYMLKQHEHRLYLGEQPAKEKG